MKLFKKLAAIALVAVMALAMVGCYSAPAGATLNDKQATALAALVKTDREAAGKTTELNRSAEVEAILADYAKAMVDYFSNRTDDEAQEAFKAAGRNAMTSLAQLKIDGKQIDMDQSVMALGIGDNGPITPSYIKDKAQNTMTKVDGELVKKDTWKLMVSADGSYLAVVWAEKGNSTVAIVMNIVLK